MISSPAVCSRSSISVTSSSGDHTEDFDPIQIDWDDDLQTSGRRTGKIHFARTHAGQLKVLRRENIAHFSGADAIGDEGAQDFRQIQGTLLSHMVVGDMSRSLDD